MKLLITAAVILTIFSHTYTTPACLAASFCQGCDTTDTSKCSFCYTWGALSMAGSAAAATTCTAAVPSTYAITSCLEYGLFSPDNVYTSMAVPAIANSPRCKICDGKTYLNIDAAAATETCSDTGLTLTGTVYICSEPIEGCAQTVCYKSASAEYKWCNRCSNNYYPSGIVQMDSATTFRAASCTKGIMISYCYYYIVNGTSNVPACESCQDGFVASYDFSGCEAADSTTSFCNSLAVASVSGTAKTCGICWTGAYFNGASCAKHGSQMFLSLAVIWIGVYLA